MSIKLGDIEGIRKLAKKIRKQEVMCSVTFLLTVILLIVLLAVALIIILYRQLLPSFYREAVIFFAGVSVEFLLERIREYYSAVGNYGAKIPDAIEKVVSEAKLGQPKLKRCKEIINAYRVQLQENEDKSLRKILMTLQKIVENE